jgi:hypothetical protein
LAFTDVARKEFDSYSVYPLGPRTTTFTGATIVDRYAKKLSPADADPGLLPVAVRGDGNCCYRAMSFLWFGNEERHVEMRARIAVEMALHSSHYQFDTMFEESMEGQELIKEFTKTVGSEGKYGEAATVAMIYDEEMMATCTVKQWAGIFQICAFAGLTGHPVQSVYPNTNTEIRATLNRMVRPRNPAKDQAVLTIMYSKATTAATAFPPPVGWWSPDHFVPCIPVAHCRQEYEQTPTAIWSTICRQTKGSTSRKANVKQMKKGPVLTPNRFASLSSVVEETANSKPSITKSTVLTSAQVKPTTSSKKAPDEKSAEPPNPQFSWSTISRQPKRKTPQKIDVSQPNAPILIQNRFDTLSAVAEEMSVDPPCTSNPDYSPIVGDSTISNVEEEEPMEHDSQASNKSYSSLSNNSESEESCTENEETGSSFTPYSDPTASVTLNVSDSFFKRQGRLAAKNLQRSIQRENNPVELEGDSRLGVQRSKLTDSLAECVKSLWMQVMEPCRADRKSQIAACATVGDQLLKDTPTLKTQDAGKLFTKVKDEFLAEDDSLHPRRTSMEIFEVLCKQLNVMQIYIHGTAYILEDKTNLRTTVESLQDISKEINIDHQLNQRIKDRIGSLYSNALQYMDTKRDSDTLKGLIAVATSTTFAAELQEIQNKKPIQSCKAMLKSNIRTFQELKKSCQVVRNNMTNENQRLLQSRLVDKAKETDMRHTAAGQGAILKCEQFPELAAVLQYAFGEGDRIERGGGGLETDPRFQTGTLFKTSDANTTMKDARLTLLSVTPPEFSISLSSCYNYTQNYKAATHQARQHHAGKGINACISLHTAPRTKTRDLVINTHHTSAKVNYILDYAAKHPDEFLVDSKDAKTVVKPDGGLRGNTWKVIEEPDHDFEPSRDNACTPMTHLLLESKITTFDPDMTLQRIDLNLPDSNTILQVTRTGQAVTLVNLSYYERETVSRLMNEIFYMLTIPALDKFFRNPKTQKLKSNFVFVVDNGPSEAPSGHLLQMWLVRLQQFLQLDSVTQVSFAEYNSKRNPVEHVHAQENLALQRHGSFSASSSVGKACVGTEEHKANMELMAEEVRSCIQTASFGGNQIMAFRGLGSEENLLFDDEDELRMFLKFNEERKATSDLTYEVKQSPLLNTLQMTWGVLGDFSSSYSEDYATLNNETGHFCNRDKYTCTIFGEGIDQNRKKILQPVPDFIRWWKTGGELHYLTVEQRLQLSEGPWDTIAELFLPTRVLDLVYKAFQGELPQSLLTQISILSFCAESEVESYFKKKQAKNAELLSNDSERETYKCHPMYKNNTVTQLRDMCRKAGHCDIGAKHVLVRRLTTGEQVLVGQQFDGNLSTIPHTAAGLQKLSLAKLRQIVSHYGIICTTLKDELIVNTLLVLNGRREMIFQREREALLDLINVVRRCICALRDLYTVLPSPVYRQRTNLNHIQPRLVDEQPRLSAGSVAKRTKSIIVPPMHVNMNNLHSLFEELQDCIRQRQDIKGTNADAFFVRGTRVLIKWNADDVKGTGWEPGWYSGEIEAVNLAQQEVTVCYKSEQGQFYNINVLEHLQQGILRLASANIPDSDVFDTIVEVGTRIKHKCTKATAGTKRIVGNWYLAEVQQYDPDEDHLDIMYTSDPNVTHSIPLSPALNSKQLKLAHA